MNHQQRTVLETMLRMLSCVYASPPGRPVRRYFDRADASSAIEGANVLAINLLGADYSGIADQAREIQYCAINLKYDSPEVE